MVDPETGQEWVYVLTRWTTCADGIEYGPQVFGTHLGARRHVAGMVYISERGWWKQHTDRWIRWADRSNHSAGFWEIIAREVRP